VTFVATTGDRLMAKLESVGMSKRQLAIRSGVSYRATCRICNGDRLGNLDTWLRFADVLGCDLDEIVGKGEERD